MELEKKVNTSKNGLIGIVIISVLLLSSACGYITYHYQDIKYWNNLIYPGVTVDGISLSGKTKAEALAVIRGISAERVSKGKINIIEGKNNYTLGYSELNLKFDIDSAVDQAYAYGKNLNLFHKYILLKKPNYINYKLTFSYNKEPVKNLIKTIESDVNTDPRDATLEATGNSFNVVSEKSGRRVQQDRLEKEILTELDKGVSSDVQVSVPTETFEPRIKADMIKGINSRIGGFTTNFGAISSPERANNIIISTKSINGKVLLPGDVFSFNDIVGERTSERGYEAAPVIVDNRLESGLGGGICQVSSTLYNAVYNAGMTSLERTHHTLPVHYVPEGMDATVDYGNIDYKFKNTLKYPVYIQAYTAGGNVIFNLYSNAAARN